MYVRNASTILVVTAIILTSLIVSLPASAQDYNIPPWVKNNTKQWSQGQIDDSEFVKGIQYLIQQEIMKIPQTSSSSSSSNVIPSWIKNNAGWWANGTISDDDFVKEIQYLVQSGIIHVSTTPDNQAENSSIAQPNQGGSELSTSTCKVINNILPDPKCTPGAIDPRVTQDNIDSTICVSGYTKTVRPPVSVTEPIKLERLQAYGFTDSQSNYELDHLIPLELGGAPADVKNLWPEPYHTTPNAYNKDGFENYLHNQVCSGTMDLQTAQNEIATNWFKYWSEIHPTSTQVLPNTTTVANTTSQFTPSYQKTNPTQSSGTLYVDLQGQNTISRGSVQSMTVVVTDGTNHVSDASVSVLVTYASGETTKNFGGMTDPAGQYNFSWRIGGHSTPGTFEVNVDASKDGYSSAHGVISFQVVSAR